MSVSTAPALRAARAAAAVGYGPLEHQLAFHLRLAQEASFAAFARRTGQAALRPGRFAILTIIGDRPGISQTALGVAAGRDKSTLTPALTDLERRGFVRRERPLRDRRSYALHLTEAGAAMLDTLRGHAAAHDAAMDALLTKRDRAALLGLLRRITVGLAA